MLNERRTTSIIRRIINAIITLIFILLQLALYTILYFEIYASTYVQLIAYILGVILVMYILQTRYNSSYKISWIVLILLFPVFGTLMYFFVGAYHPLPERKIKKINAYIKDYIPVSKTADEVFQDDLVAKKHAKILQKQAPVGLYTNTAIEYYKDPVPKYNDMIEKIKNAKNYIFMEYFIISDGFLWNDILEILLEKARAGVEVKIIYDDIGSLRSLDKGGIKRLNKNPNFRMVAYNPMGIKVSLGLNYRDHRKAVIIDGEYAYSGGDNIADEYIHKLIRFGKWRDTGFRLTGDAVKQYILMFVEMWYMSTKEMLDAKQYIKETNVLSDAVHIPFGDGPHNKVELSYDVVTSMVDNSQKYLYISTPYLIVNREFILNIAKLSESGVKVVILVPKIPDKKITFWLTQAHYKDILAAGGKIYEYTPGFNHAKMVLSDDKYLLLGTINMDFRSFFLNFESGDLIIGDEVIKEVKKDFEEQLAISKEVTYDEWCKRPLIKKIVQFVLYIFAVLF